MAPPFVACRICRNVEGKLKNYKNSQFFIKAYEELSGCPFVEMTYLTKFCPQCACLIRRMYKFKKKCIASYRFVIEHMDTGRKITKPFIQMTGSYHKTVNLSTWQTKDVPIIDCAHNPKAYKSKKKSVVEGILNIKHLTVPKDPSAEIPIKPKPVYSSGSEFDLDDTYYDIDYCSESFLPPEAEQLAGPTLNKETSNVLEPPLNTLEETPMNVPETSVNVLETPVNVTETPVNVLEIPMNVLETQVNVLETPLNVLETHVCGPDLMVNEAGNEVDVKIEDGMNEDVLEVTEQKLEVKLEIDPDPDDLTLHEIKAELLSATETKVDVGSAERVKRKKTDKKKEIQSQVSKKSQRLQVQARRRKSNQELEEHFTITQFLTEDEQVQEFLKRREGEGYREGKFKCELCLKSFKEQKWMDAHVKKHEPGAGAFVCSICQIRCRTPKLHRTHRDCNHTTRYACRRCSFLTYSKAQALKHHGWHEGVQHACPHCGATFRKHTTYMGHVRRVHPSAHICGACARSFVSAYGLNLHVKAVHKEITKPANDGARCESCDVTFVSRQMYIRHVLITDKHKDISKDILGCRKCGEQFETREQAERHSHHAERRRVRRDAPRRAVPCDQCSEVFSHPNGVYQHYLRAHPDTPYRFAVRRHYLCEQCGKTFKSPGLLRQHALTHQGLRPPPAKKPPGRNACRLCGKTYSKLSGLFRHKLTHMGVRRHKCHICEKAFTDTSNLKQHVQGVHLNIRRIRKR